MLPNDTQEVDRYDLNRGEKKKNHKKKRAPTHRHTHTNIHTTHTRTNATHRTTRQWGEEQKQLAFNIREDGSGRKMGEERRKTAVALVPASIVGGKEVGEK